MASGRMFTEPVACAGQESVGPRSNLTPGINNNKFISFEIFYRSNCLVNFSNE